jgi:hypothetical protein
MDARRVDLFGRVEAPSRRQAEERAHVLCAEYRSAVQAAILAGSGMDAAHEAARPIQRKALAVLAEAGVPPMVAQGLVALEFHG